MTTQFYKLLDNFNENEIIKVEDGAFRYVYGLNTWIETSIFFDYRWPENILYEQYEAISIEEMRMYIELNTKYYEQLLELSIHIATIAHINQVDKGGKPYIDHPKYVAAQFDELELKIVAMLHDVCEDSEYKSEDLIDLGFPIRLVESVNVLTKSTQEPYMSYLAKVKKNEIARRVKIEDIKHNLDRSRILNFSSDDQQRESKYKSALSFLVE